MSVRLLGTADAQHWVLRVPTLVLSGGTVLCFALALASTWNVPTEYATSLDDAVSWMQFVESATLGVIVGAVLIAGFAPRVAAWTMAVGVFPPLVGDGMGSVFPVLGWAWCGVVVLDAVLVIRQRARATWVAPTSAPGPAWRTEHHLAVRLVASLVLAVAAVVPLVLFVQWRGDVRELAERAVPTEKKIVAVDTFFDSVTVRIDGEDHELFVPDASGYAVGDAYEVMVDPLGEMAPYTAEDADPQGRSDIAAITGGAVVLLWVVLVEMSRRRRALERVASTGGPGADALVRWHPIHEGLEVFAGEDVRGERPLVFLPSVEPMWPAANDDGPAGLRGALHDAVDMAEVLTSRERRTEIERQLDEVEALDLSALTPARVSGLLSDGSLCVVRVGPPGDEAVAGNVRPARDRWTLRTVVLEGRARVTGRPIGVHLAGSSEDNPSVEARQLPRFLPLVRFLRSTARFGVPVLVVVGALVVPWLLEGESFSFGVIALAVLAGRVASWWWGLARPQASESRWGIRVFGGWWDELILPHEISDVRRLADEVVIELGEYEYYTIGRDLTLPLTEQQPKLDRVVAEVERARLRAHRGELAAWPSSWPRRLPSSATAAGLLVAGAWLAAAIWG